MDATRTPRTSEIEIPVQLAFADGKLRHVAFGDDSAKRYILGLQRIRGNCTGLELVCSTAMIRLR